MKFGQKDSTRIVAIGGVFLALSIAFLFLATFIPNIELTMFTLASFLVVFVIIETSTTGGWIFYMASVFITFTIVPNKAGIIPYTLFFGLYPILKYYFESIKKLSFVVLLIIKLVLCNVLFGAGIIFFQQVFVSAINLPDVAFPILIIGAQVFFLVYDYILTLAVGFYLKKRPKG